MKLGQLCQKCGGDYWIRSNQHSCVRCGVCFPARINHKKQWPRICKVQHAEFYRKNGTAKPLTMNAHRITFSDFELANCMAVEIYKEKAEMGRFYYRIIPIFKNEFKSYSDMRGNFARIHGR